MQWDPLAGSSDPAGARGQLCSPWRRPVLQPPRPRAAGKWDATDTQWLRASCRSTLAPSTMEETCPLSPHGWCWPFGGTWVPSSLGTRLRKEGLESLGHHTLVARPVEGPQQHGGKWDTGEKQEHPRGLWPHVSLSGVYLAYRARGDAVQPPYLQHSCILLCKWLNDFLLKACMCQIPALN